jgi:hypothetical protein
MSSMRGPPFQVAVNETGESSDQPVVFATTSGRQRYGWRSENLSIQSRSGEPGTSSAG